MIRINGLFKKEKAIIPIAALFLFAGCSSMSGLQRVSLSCKAIEGQCFSFYSFTEGMVTPPIKPDQVDLLYYFDGDDCSQGALIGQDDRPGYLFPIGYKSWSKLARLKSPSDDTESVAGISPMTKDKEGLALWVKDSGGEYVLVKISTVQPTFYSDLLSGRTATLEFEWARPQNRAKSRG